ncbi:MAG: endonuclease III [Actinomycetota bacterium]
MRLPSERRDIVHELVHAVLSQNTSRRNYNLAYARLIESFPAIEQLAAAPVGRIERAIKPGGLSYQKSAAIKEILARIQQERGDLSLEFVRDMKVTEAREWLTSLPGVGPKTASVVLMFADGRKVLPVDTHVLRTSKRIGLIDSDATAEKAQEILEEIVPPAIRPRMHLNLVELGREICHARNPAHEICPVNMLCDLVMKETV